jgi:hypothetical protein
VTIIQSGTGSARLGRWVTRQALEFTIDCWNGLLDNHTCPTAGRRLKPGLHAPHGCRFRGIASIGLKTESTLWIPATVASHVYGIDIGEGERYISADTHDGLISHRAAALDPVPPAIEPTPTTPWL